MTVARTQAWGAELQAVHRRLREALDLAREAIEDEPPANDAPARDLLLYCWGFCVALDGHHRSEDAALFPRLIGQRPDLAPVVAQLRQDHSMISYLIAGLQQAVERRAGPADRLRHLDGIEAVMETHFRYEERRLLPLLESADWPEDQTVDHRDLFGPLADLP